MNIQLWMCNFKLCIIFRYPLLFAYFRDNFEQLESITECFKFPCKVAHLELGYQEIPWCLPSCLNVPSVQKASQEFVVSVPENAGFLYLG